MTQKIDTELDDGYTIPDEFENATFSAKPRQKFLVINRIRIKLFQILAF